MAAWLGVVPPLLAVLYAGWCGNLLGGVTAPGSTVALVLLLAMVAAFACPVRDPLRLGRAGRLLPWACWLVAAASAWRSPVPRASLEAVVLLPAYLCLPAAVARCWSDAAARRLGARAMAAAVGLLSAWALVGYREGGGAGFQGLVVSGAGRAAALPPLGAMLTPLGHHTLLAVWLAILLPLALLPLREPTAWRWLAAAAGLLGIAAAVKVGHSLAGDWALACEALAAAAWAASAARARRRREGRAEANPGGSSGSPGTSTDNAGTSVAGSRGRSGVYADSAERESRVAASRDHSSTAGAAAVWRAGNPSGHARRRPLRLAVVLALLGIALAAVEGRRLWRVAAGDDPSARAREIYLRAGWEGWLERPWLGWGPGSVPWTAAWFLAPRPGVNPWGEAVGELHSLPVHLAYETGALGLLAAVALGGWYLRCRWLERWTAADPGWLAAGCLGMAGASLALLGTAALAVAALPLALATAAGAALAGGRRDAAGSLAAAGEADQPLAAGEGGMEGLAADPRSAPGGVAEVPAPGCSAAPRGVSVGAGVAVAVRVYVLVAAAALLAPELARWHYDRAVAAGETGARREAMVELAAAARLDPGFPLYRTRLAMLRDPGGAGGGAAAALALEGARQARGVGLLWLVAGLLGRAAGEVWAPAAFEQSCALDPFAPYPPFYLAASAAEEAVPRLAARALLAEPRLLAATWWEGREPLFRRSLEEVRRWPGVDAGWKLALLRAAPRPADRRGVIGRLSLNVDTAGFTAATSLHLFRRLPWPAQWPLVALRQGVLPEPPLPPATSLASTARGTFDTRGCLPGR
jgi:hypothetical protein